MFGRKIAKKLAKWKKSGEPKPEKLKSEAETNSGSSADAKTNARTFADVEAESRAAEERSQETGFIAQSDTESEDGAEIETDPTAKIVVAAKVDEVDGSRATSSRFRSLNKRMKSMLHRQIFTGARQEKAKKSGKEKGKAPRRSESEVGFPRVSWIFPLQPRHAYNYSVHSSRTQSTFVRDSDDGASCSNENTSACAATSRRSLTYRQMTPPIPSVDETVRHGSSQFLPMHLRSNSYHDAARPKETRRFLDDVHIFGIKYGPLNPSSRCLRRVGTKYRCRSCFNPATEKKQVQMSRVKEEDARSNKSKQASASFDPNEGRLSEGSLCASFSIPQMSDREEVAGIREEDSRSRQSTCSSSSSEAFDNIFIEHYRRLSSSHTMPLFSGEDSSDSSNSSSSYDFYKLLCLELRAEAEQRRAAETFMAALVQGDGGVRGAGRTGETECHGEGRGFGESEGTGGAETVGGTGGSARIGGNRETGPVRENGGGAVGCAGNPSPRDIHGGNREFFV